MYSLDFAFTTCGARLALSASTPVCGQREQSIRRDQKLRIRARFRGTL